MPYTGRRPWERIEHWPHCILGTCILGTTHKVTVAREGRDYPIEDVVALAIWAAYDRHPTRVWLPTPRALILADAIRTEATVPPDEIVAADGRSP